MEKRKIAIMSWYTYINFGTALQAAALYHNIDNIGYEPNMIQYRPRESLPRIPRNQCVYWGEKLAKKLIYRAEEPYQSDERKKRFSSFLDSKLKVTPPCHTYPELCELNERYDAFVCGSDQIWSLVGFDDNYFLPFVNNPNKKIAYAPSMGQRKFLCDERKKRFKVLISSFRHLSVREAQSADLIKKMTGKEAKTVLDPTLLMNAAQWDEYLGNRKDTDKNGSYILCYFLGHSERYMKYVKKLAVHLKLPYYFIPVTKKQKDSQHVWPREVGPEEFVSLIKNAAFVCTDSFHGLAFSVIYNTPFCVFRRFKEQDLLSQNIRITDFLDRIQMRGQLVDPKRYRGIEQIVRCNFSDANRILEELRHNSVTFLRSSLESAVNACVETEENKTYQIAHSCCGCGACAVICPCKAIDMVWDLEGFQRYQIDESRCIRCGKCRSICPMVHVSASPLNNARELYSAKSSSETAKVRSSSGGIGFELAKLASQKGYTVCGCIYDSKINRAKHILIPGNRPEDVTLLQGSKYLQSITADAFRILYHDNKNCPICFFGTPCQTAALDKILRQQGRRSEALLVDLICHGVPSANLWDGYLRQIDQNYGTGQHPDAVFRYRSGQETIRKICVEGNGRVYLKDERKDDFYAMFRRGLCHMAACFECPYREKSAADLRIGDYWGSGFENERERYSMVIANTDDGIRFLHQLSDLKRCEIQRHELSEYWLVQYPYNVKSPDVRNELLQKLSEQGADVHKLRKAYCGFYDMQEKLAMYKHTIKRMVRR